MVQRFRVRTFPRMNQTPIRPTTRTVAGPKPGSAPDHDAGSRRRPSSPRTDTAHTPYAESKDEAVMNAAMPILACFGTVFPVA